MTKGKEDNIKSLEQERSELASLLNKGIEFEVDDVQFEVKSRFFGLVKTKEPIKIKRQFSIGELTLGTLDRLSAEWIEFDIDESMMQSDGMKKAKGLAHNHSIRCAKIIALAVLDSDYLIPTNVAGRYKEDNKTLTELTNLFAHTIKPSELFYLVSVINVMSNLGDFTNSIRLMLSERTTMPHRIEGNIQA